MAARLKTYRTQSGFFELIVAAPNQKAALDAWGSHANLFQQGFAAPTDDAEAVAAATTRPGVVLRRAVGTADPWRAPEEEADLPDVPDGPKPKARSGPKATKAEPPPKPDRSALDAAEKALAAHRASVVAEEARRGAELEGLQRRHDAEREREARREEELETARQRAAQARTSGRFGHGEAVYRLQRF